MTETSPTHNSSYTLAAGSEVTFDIMCTPCDTDGDIKEAEGFCSDCQEYLCAQCLKFHKKVTATKDHVLIIDKESLPEAEGVSDVCKQRCNTHRNEVIKYYCPSHKSLGCGDCMIRNHDKCIGKVFIPDEATHLEESAEFKNFQALIENLTKKSNDMIRYLKANMNSSSDYKTIALQELEAFRKEINDQLDKQKAALDEQIDKIVANEHANMNSIAVKTSQIQTELQQISSMFESYLKKKQHCQMFVDMKDKENKLRELQRQLEQTETKSFSAFCFQPNEDLQQLVRKKHAIGKLLIKDAKKTSAKLVADIYVKTAKTEKTCRITGAALISKDKLAIVDWNNSAVKLIDTNSQKVIANYKNEDVPFDVASPNENKIAVTIPFAKKILLMRADEFLALETEIAADGTCLFITSTDGKLVVSYNDPCEVRVLSMTGEMLHVFSASSQGEPLFHSKPHVTVNTFLQTMYVSEWDDNRVTMLNNEGKIIAEHKDEDLQSPSYSAVDEFGMVYVCGAKTNTVHLLTPNLGKVSVLLTDHDDIKRPRCVCYCRETKRLFVGMGGCDTVNIYQLQ